MEGKVNSNSDLGGLQVILEVRLTPHTGVRVKEAEQVSEQGTNLAEQEDTYNMFTEH